MKKETAKYITTTLPYVNADPHIGFAFEILVADAVARSWRLANHEVFFTTGTDEHGQKIAEKADAEGKTRQAYVDHFANEFKKLGEALDLSYDNFIRTTDRHHERAAEEMWNRCLASGDIYKKKYQGLYCVGDEAFLKETDLVDGRCPNHPNLIPQEVEEENYFFALSKYQNYLQDYLSTSGVIEPNWRRLEALKFVENGLEDFSISREKSRLDWGIPVPNDDTQVMYVWFDALTNYISTLGWPETAGDFEKFWQQGEVVQLAGKDQVRFQSIMWQAMLKSAGLKATDKVVYHGFITSGGQKMSKSLGNTINPYDLVNRYGTEATRYLLLRHVHPFDDSDITIERCDELYTAGLVNGLGNLTARIMKMSETHLDGGYTELPEYLNIENYNLQSALDTIWQGIQKLDERITETEPFKLVKTDPETAKDIIFDLRKQLVGIGYALAPFMPQTSKIIVEAVATNTKPDNLFARLDV